MGINKRWNNLIKGIIDGKIRFDTLLKMVLGMISPMNNNTMVISSQLNSGFSLSSSLRVAIVANVTATKLFPTKITIKNVSGWLIYLDSALNFPGFCFALKSIRILFDVRKAVSEPENINEETSAKMIKIQE